MRDEMQVGDRLLFYHSSAKPPAVAGTATVVRSAYPDDTAWDPDDDHYDPQASLANPIWQMVDIKLEKIFRPEVPIGKLRQCAALQKMELLRRGSRLSVQPVRPREFAAVLEIAESLARDKAGETCSASRKAARLTSAKKRVPNEP